MSDYLKWKEYQNNIHNLGTGSVKKKESTINYHKVGFKHGLLNRPSMDIIKKGSEDHYFSGYDSGAAKRKKLIKKNKKTNLSPKNKKEEDSLIDLHYNDK